MTATATVRTTHLEVSIDGAPDVTAYAATCSFGFDQRYAEATVWRTGGGTVAIAYWSEVEIALGTTPGEGAAVRFAGYVVPIENALYPIASVLHCKGRLYRAAFVKNTAAGGTVMAEPGVGQSDEQQVRDVLDSCGVPTDPGNIGGTGRALGSVYVDLGNLLAPGPFTWAEQQSGLDYIEALDEVCVLPGAGGRLRTYERLAGLVVRHAVATDPGPTPNFSFTEGVDVLEARITRDPTGAANRVTVTGAPTPKLVVTGTGIEVVYAAQARFTVESGSADYLPPGVAQVTATLSSPLIEKSTEAEDGDCLSCQAVADFLLTETNCVLDILELSTPRDDLLEPGATVHLDSPRLGLTDPDRHYWVQHLEVSVDERGAFTQRVRAVRRS